MPIVLNPQETFTHKSYATIEWADSYFEYDIEATSWETMELELKMKALVTATKHIDSYNFRGVKQSPEQPLKFPRISERAAINLSDINRILYRDRLSDTVSNVPEAIRRACCEQALYLASKSLKGTVDVDNDYSELKKAGISDYRVGDVSVSFNSPEQMQVNSILVPKAMALVNPYIKRFGRLV